QCCTTVSWMFLFSCVVSGQRGSRAFWQFGNMIRCVQPGVNPFKYNNYGSYCGLRRRGTPVDEVDLCCKVHDECYAAQMRNPRCRGFFSQPYPFSVIFSGSVWTQIFLKRCRGRWRKKRSSLSVWTAPQCPRIPHSSHLGA
uniref:Phospholipase A2 n=1 Tax=Sparus aurata TaxID=8175 RepID=A0A671UB23_SPAAU